MDNFQFGGEYNLKVRVFSNETRGIFLGGITLQTPRPLGSLFLKLINNS